MIQRAIELANSLPNEDDRDLIHQLCEEYVIMYHKVKLLEVNQVNERLWYENED